MHLLQLLLCNLQLELVDYTPNLPASTRFGKLLGVWVALGLPTDGDISSSCMYAMGGS